jgi:hypothetical protein
MRVEDFKRAYDLFEDYEKLKYLIDMTNKSHVYGLTVTVKFSSNTTRSISLKNSEVFSNILKELDNIAEETKTTLEALGVTNIGE